MRANQAVYQIHHSPSRLPVKRSVTIILMLGVCGLAIWISTILMNPATLPIEKIRVQGNFLFIEESMLNEAITEIKSQGFFSLDIQAVREQVETLPWVAQASIRRVWPNGLAIHVVEQQPLARWSEGGLINTQGEWFNPLQDTYPKGLPVFSGPKILQTEMSQYYATFTQLLKPLSLSIEQLETSSRSAVNIYLDNGMKLVLGREQQQVRLQRFIRVYNKLFASKASEVAQIDLRYSNGMSVTWRKTQEGGQL